VLLLPSVFVADTEGDDGDELDEGANGVGEVDGAGGAEEDGGVTSPVTSLGIFLMSPSVPSIPAY
tara:strand:+ start:319 stop:513 length:195 start_codon:yes stop_codon:yes gene_type:complete